MSDLSQQLLEEITTAATANGAILVGTTKIRRTEPVIIFAFPYSEKWFFSYPITLTRRLGKQYFDSKRVQNLTAQILQQAGFRAEYKTILSVFGDFRPLAVSAGLGEWGRNGLVVNKDYGSGLLFAGLFTDAPLELSAPLAPEVATAHCSDCGQCIQSCPANAFANGYFHYYKCLPYAVRGCAECIKACQH